MADLISREGLSEEIKSLQVTVTGLQAGKGVLAAYANEFRDSVLRIIDEQPTVAPGKNVTEPAEKAGNNVTADEELRGLGYERNTSACYGYDKGKIIYEHSVMCGTDIFTITFFKSNKWCFFAENTARSPIMLDKFVLDAVQKKMSELYAHKDIPCAPLAREMEEKK